MTTQEIVKQLKESIAYCKKFIDVKAVKKELDMTEEMSKEDLLEDINNWDFSISEEAIYEAGKIAGLEEAINLMKETK